MVCKSALITRSLEERPCSKCLGGRGLSIFWFVCLGEGRRNLIIWLYYYYPCFTDGETKAQGG